MATSWVQAGATAASGGLQASAAATPESIAQIGAQTTVGILLALGTISGPVGAAVAAIIAVAGLIASHFHGCGQTCIQASQIADKVEVALQDNLTHYMNAPDHYLSLQQGALNNADFALAALGQACGNPALGAAGKRCISERLVRGGTAPWCPKPGHTGCDWYVLYRDPIANDPRVKPNPGLTALGGNSVPTVNTSAPVASPESKPSNLVGGPTAAQLQAFVNRDVLNADQWSFYYAQLSGVPQRTDLFPAGDRGALLTVGQYYANRAAKGLPIGSRAASQPSGSDTAAYGVAGSSSSPGGYGGFFALAIAAALAIWLKVRS